MVIRGWVKRYKEILKEFNYDQKEDMRSALKLDSILAKTSIDIVQDIIHKKTCFVIGSGPSLTSSIKIIKKHKNVVKIVADSAVSILIKNKIKPNIVVSDLDGDEKYLKIASKVSTMVIHAHGDNIQKLDMAKKFKKCIGTTQTRPFGKLYNFGGFTDGDRAVFLADHFEAKNIILFGMDFEDKIGKHSQTIKSQRDVKLKKLLYAKNLLVWLAKNTRCNLYTTSSPIDGFKKIRYKDVDIIVSNAF